MSCSKKLHTTRMKIHHHYGWMHVLHKTMCNVILFLLKNTVKYKIVIRTCCMKFIIRSNTNVTFMIYVGIKMWNMTKIVVAPHSFHNFPCLLSILYTCDKSMCILFFWQKYELENGKLSLTYKKKNNKFVNWKR